MAEPVLPLWLSGLLLLLTGLLARLRIGADSAARYTGDLVRLNKYLAEQNRDLAENNHALLKSILAQDLDDEDQISD